MSGAVSAFIICKNEAAFIGDCLRSLNFCNDIVVVDSGSTDDTLSIIEACRVEGLPIRLFQRAWPGFAAQKQFALDQATGPWCLGLDADERADDGLAVRIATLPDAEDGGPVAYMIAKREYLPGYGYTPHLVYRRHMLRLVRKSRARYDLSQAVHEKLLPDRPAARLDRGEILHFRNLSIAEETRKADIYADLKARDRAARGRKGSLVALACKPFWQFLKFYLVQRYFLCGKAGFIHAAMQAQYVFLTEAKLARMTSGADVPDM